MPLPPATYQLHMLNRQRIHISPPNCLLLRIKHSGRETPCCKKKPLVAQYNKQANKAEIRYVTPDNVQECLEDMDLDFSKFNKFKA